MAGRDPFPPSPAGPPAGPAVERPTQAAELRLTVGPATAGGTVPSVDARYFITASGIAACVAAGIAGVIMTLRIASHVAALRAGPRPARYRGHRVPPAGAAPGSRRPPLSRPGKEGCLCSGPATADVTRRTSQEKMDELGLFLGRIPDEHFLAVANLSVYELVQRDGTVREVSLGQAAPLLELLKVRGSLRDEGHGDSLRRR